MVAKFWREGELVTLYDRAACRYINTASAYYTSVRRPTNCRYFSSLRMISHCAGFSASAELLVLKIVTRICNLWRCKTTPTRKEKLLWITWPMVVTEIPFTFSFGAASSKRTEFFTGNYILWHPPHSCINFEMQATTVTLPLIFLTFWTQNQ